MKRTGIMKDYPVAEKVYFGSRMPFNTCQSCGHNSTFDITRFGGCSNCGRKGPRDPKLFWDYPSQEWCRITWRHKLVEIRRIITISVLTAWADSIRVVKR